MTKETKIGRLHSVSSGDMDSSSFGRTNNTEFESEL